jgi:hypothetical protein
MTRPAKAMSKSPDPALDPARSWSRTKTVPANEAAPGGPFTSSFTRVKVVVDILVEAGEELNARNCSPPTSTPIPSGSPNVCASDQKDTQNGYTARDLGFVFRPPSIDRPVARERRSRQRPSLERRHPSGQSTSAANKNPGNPGAGCRVPGAGILVRHFNIKTAAADPRTHVCRFLFAR